MKLQHKFVAYIPDNIEEGVLYISLDYGTVIHKCACGCGNEVNTPLTPTGWKMIYNGKAISLKPSVGNWSFNCKSHYWITDDKIEWSNKWSDEKINSVRENENSETEEFYKNNKIKILDNETFETKDSTLVDDERKSWFQKLLFWK